MEDFGMNKGVAFSKIGANSDLGANLEHVFFHKKSLIRSSTLRSPKSKETQVL